MVFLSIIRLRGRKVDQGKGLVARGSFQLDRVG